MVGLRVPFEQALKDAGVNKGELNHVILVGGSTRMPTVTDLVQNLDRLREGFANYLPIGGLVAVLMVLEIVIVLTSGGFGEEQFPRPEGHGEEHGRSGQPPT